MEVTPERLRDPRVESRETYQRSATGTLEDALRVFVTNSSTRASSSMRSTTLNSMDQTPQRNGLLRKINWVLSSPICHTSLMATSRWPKLRQSTSTSPTSGSQNSWEPTLRRDPKSWCLEESSVTYKRGSLCQPSWVLQKKSASKRCQPCYRVFWNSRDQTSFWSLIKSQPGLISSSSNWLTSWDSFLRTKSSRITHPWRFTTTPSATYQTWRSTWTTQMPLRRNSFSSASKPKSTELKTGESIHSTPLSSSNKLCFQERIWGTKQDLISKTSSNRSLFWKNFKWTNVSWT